LNGTITDDDKLNFRKLVDDFLKINNLNAVILGCTELPLIFGHSEDNKIIDTLQVLAKALLVEYFNK